MSFDTLSPLLALLCGSAALTAALSGALGMGGGSLLLVIWAGLLPARETLALHGLNQGVANGSRAWMLRRHIRWQVVGWQLAGAALAAGLLAWLRFTPSTLGIFLALGLLPLVVALIPRRLRPGVETWWGGLLCGLLTTGAQLSVGSSGPLLDTFYLRGGLGRREVVATKAFTQSVGHALKVLYYGAALWAPAGLGWGVAPVLVAALLGTWIGRRILEAMSERAFLSLTRWLTAGLSIYALARAATL